MVVTCPVCRAASALEVTPGLNGVPIYLCRARSCGFVGDGLELYSKVRSLDMESAAIEMIARGVIQGHPGVHQEIQSHLQWYTLVQLPRDQWWHEANAVFRRGDTRAAAILQNRGCWHSREVTMGPHGIGAFLGLRTGAEIQAVGAEIKAFMINQYADYLVVPMWGDHRTITGITCFTSHGDSHTIAWEDAESVHGFGFLRSTGPHSDVVVIINHPITALEWLANAQSCASSIPMVLAGDLTSAWAQLHARQRLFLNLTDSLTTYRQALMDPSSLVVSTVDMQKPQPGMLLTPEARLAHLRTVGAPVHRSLGEFLASMTSPNARAALQQLQLSPGDIVRVLAGIPEGPRSRLEAVLRDLAENQAIAYHGDIISVTPEGWRSKKKQDVIANVVFFLDTVIHDASRGTTRVRGVAIQHRKQFAFEEDLDVIKKSTAEWLQKVLYANHGDLLDIAPGWASKLFHISMRFREPITRHEIMGSGWANENQRLVLPGITIENGAVTSRDAPGKGGGSGLQATAPDTFERVLQDTPEGIAFWAIFAALAGNICAPRHNHGTAGIALVDIQGTALELVMNDAIDAVGLPRVSLASASLAALKDIKDQELREVLPTYIDETWSQSHGFAQWQLVDARRNVIVPMTKAVALATGLQGSWVYIAPHAAPSKPQMRELLRYWNLLPQFLAWAIPNGTWARTRTGMYRELLTIAVPGWLRSRGVEPAVVLQRASDVITVDVMEPATPWGYRFLGLLIAAMRAGLLESRKVDETNAVNDAVIIDEAAETAFISRERIVALLKGIGVEPPGHHDIARRLEEASCLQGSKFRGCTGYLVSLDRWNLCWSMKA